ncbi:MAG TPA: glycoside hydrolase family 3 N-terminal domain-containing protein [Acidimicrobiales bacterium]
MPSTATPTTTLAPTTTAPTLSPDLLAGGMVLCSFSGAVVPQWALDRLRAGLAAGLLLYERNLASEAQAAANGQAAQAAALASAVALPAIVATDQEGGIVARIPGPPSGSAATMGARPAPDVEAEGRATAKLLLRWGVNTDLAPVADVARPGTFEARARRSFSGDPTVAAGGVTAFVAGLRAGGVAATLKHFPGLGAASANTDHADGVVDLPAADLDAVDLVPFRAGIGAGAQLVMVASAAYPALAPGLALTSPTIVDGLLRGMLGFQGVVISDALDARGVGVVGTPPEAAVAAATAGVDLFIAQGSEVCVELQQSLVAAMADGRLPLARAQQAFDRVAELRRALVPRPAG